jgi:hypothetical protein
MLDAPRGAVIFLAGTPLGDEVPDEIRQIATWEQVPGDAGASDGVRLD